MTDSCKTNLSVTPAKMCTSIIAFTRYKQINYVMFTVYLSSDTGNKYNIIHQDNFSQWKKSSGFVNGVILNVLSVNEN